MNIREADMNDLDDLSVLFDAYRVFYKATSAPDQAKTFLAERIRHHESAIYVAEESGELLGFIQLYPIFSSVQMKRVWLLNDLFILPAAREKGVGTALMNAAREFALKKDAAWLLLQTAEDNFTAQRLYERVGWKRETDFFYVYKP